VTLHFAYGANMNRAVMRKHAPAAVPVGAAALVDYRFVISADGYASVEPQRGARVHGVVWRLTPRDRVTLAVWENLAKGLYRVKALPVLTAGRRRMALVYVARPCAPGCAKAGYMELVIAAAQEWKLPQAYIVFLRAFLPQRPGNRGQRSLEGFGWT
jgi:Gamma-glutamyl cyclotransferase, AIG2-like